LIKRGEKGDATHRSQGVTFPLEGPRDGQHRSLDQAELTELCLKLLDGHFGLALDAVTKKL
jgi:hypothetical protein